jgi:hypothetical protein
VNNTQLILRIPTGTAELIDILKPETDAKMLKSIEIIKRFLKGCHKST